MSDTECMHEVKDLIRFYGRLGKNWLSAAEFTLSRHSGIDMETRVRTNELLDLGKVRKVLELAKPFTEVG